MIHKVIPLWESSKSAFMPTLTTYVLDDCLDEAPRKRGAVLICPGGGYGFCSPREAEPIALAMTSKGYHAFVVDYTTNGADPNMRHPQPLLDVSRAMTIIRENAAEWNIDPTKVAVCGFSAGGHLAASLGTLGNRDYIKSNPQIGDNLPNALILAYPVISANKSVYHGGSFVNLLGENASTEAIEELSLENQVSEITPPTFIWHTFPDDVVPVENALLFASALSTKKIPFDLHVYSEGGHGLSLATRETSSDHSQIIPHVQSWVESCASWLKDIMSF